MKKQIAALMALALMYVPGISVEAASYEDEIVSAGDYFELFQEDQVVQIATKAPIKIKYAPSTVNVITEEEIKRSGAKSLKQLLEKLPGVDARFSRQQNGATHLAFRGIGGRGGGSWRVLWLVDGRVANRAFEGVFEVNELFPINQIKRIEVLRGPGSALYGENAFSGVVNIITKNGGDVNGVHVETHAGDNGQWGGSVEAGQQSESMGAIVTGNWHSTEALYDHDFNFNDQAKSGHISGKINIGDAHLSTGFLETSNGIPNKRSSPNDHQEFRLREYYADMEAPWELGENTKLKAKLFGAIGTDEEFDPTKDLGPNGSDSQPRTYDEKTWGTEVQLNQKLFSQDTLVLGGSIHRYDADFPEHQKKGFTPTKAHYVFTGAFVQNEFRPWERLILTAGGRVDGHTLFNTQLTPRGSIVWGPTDSTTIKGLYGEAFRAPELRKIYAQGANLNQSLKPSQIQTTEIIVSQRIGEVAKVGVNGFYNEFNDLIGRTSKSVAYTNLHEGYVKGTEVEVEIHPTHNLKVFGNWSWQETKETTNNPLLSVARELDYAPKNKFNLGFDFEVLKNVLSLYTVGHYVGSRITEGGAKVGAYYTQDITIRATVERLEASIALYNAFDRNDFVETVDRPAIDSRTWLARLGYKFGGEE